MLSSGPLPSRPAGSSNSSISPSGGGDGLASTSFPQASSPNFYSAPAAACPSPFSPAFASSRDHRHVSFYSPPSAAVSHAQFPRGSPASSTAPSATPPSGAEPPVVAVTSPPSTDLLLGACMFPPASGSLSPALVLVLDAAVASPCATSEAKQLGRQDLAVQLNEEPGADDENPKKPGRSGGDDDPLGPVRRPTKVLMDSPQNPHYIPLQNRAKRIRRNLISGYNKAFMEMAETIWNITYPEFQSGEKELSMTLEELEAMGYSVTPLRNRLDALRGAVREREAAGKDVERLMKKVEERKEDLRLLQVEIAQLQTKELGKEEGIRELVRWAEEIKGNLKELDDIFGDMVRTSLL